MSLSEVILMVICILIALLPFHIVTYHIGKQEGRSEERQRK